MTLLRSFTGVLAAFAIAASGLAFSSRPAHAIDSDDVFRLLLGAAGVAVLMRAWNDSPWDERTRRERQYPQGVLPAYCLETVRSRGRGIEAYNSNCLYRSGAQALPLRCQSEVRTNRGLRDMFSRQCLLDAGFREESASTRPVPPRYDPPRYTPPRSAPPRGVNPRPALLPASCQLNYRVMGSRLTGYYADCLDRAGLRNLPAQCSLHARLGNVRHMIYSAGCLRDLGYRTSRG